MAPRSKDPTSRALTDALYAFFRAYKAKTRAILAEVSSGQTASRVMVVVVLRKHGSLPMGSIAMHVGLPKSNITALVDDLEAEGVLRRKRDDVDRRITHVELTAKGRALCAREYDAYERKVGAIFDVVPPSERGPLLSAFERMTKHMLE
jgi:MarR family 2-MHQ and catechol resistance regulon transcriptional repressor